MKEQLTCELVLMADSVMTCNAITLLEREALRHIFKIFLNLGVSWR